MTMCVGVCLDEDLPWKKYIKYIENKIAIFTLYLDLNLRYHFFYQILLSQQMIALQKL